MSPQCLATKITLSRFQIEWYNENKDTKHGTLNSFIEITKSLMSSDKIFLTHCTSLGKRNFFPFCFLWLVIAASECLYEVNARKSRHKPQPGSWDWQF